MVKILVCGGRDFGDLPPSNHELYEQCLAEKMFVLRSLDTKLGSIPANDLTIISGCAKGPDSIALEWAATNGTYVKRFRADWGSYKKAAGIIRNKQMLEEGEPDVVLAFPGGTGTANMKSIAKAAGVKVIEYTWEPYEQFTRNK